MLVKRFDDFIFAEHDDDLPILLIVVDLINALQVASPDQLINSLPLRLFLWSDLECEKMSLSGSQNRTIFFA